MDFEEIDAMIPITEIVDVISEKDAGISTINLNSGDSAYENNGGHRLVHTW